MEQKEIPMLEHTHSEPVIENEVKSTCKDAGHPGLDPVVSSQKPSRQILPLPQPGRNKTPRETEALCEQLSITSL